MKLTALAVPLAALVLAGCGKPAATAGKLVSIAYTLKVNGQVVDSATAEKPFSFTIGDGSVIPGMEEAVLNKRAGDKINVVLSPDKAYGVPDPQLLQEVPLAALGGQAVKPGDELTARTPDGRAMNARVVEVGKKTVKMDFNHPLAGQALDFSITLLDVKNK